MKKNLIKPDWFDDWFSENFPDSVSKFSPKEVAAGFGVSVYSIYRSVKSGSLGAIQVSSSSSIIIPRDSIYDFALSCYTLNS